MKLTATIYLLAAGTILFFSCKKDNDQVNTNCVNCIVIGPDSLVNQDSTGGDTTQASVTTIVVNGPEATIDLNASGNFPDSRFVISIGDSAQVIANQQFNLAGEPLNLQWSFTDLSPGTHPVRITQSNYVPGFAYPSFNFTITTPNETISSVVPQPQVNGSEVVYVFNLQAN